MAELTAIQSAETVAALRAIAGTERELATPCRDLFAKHFLSLKSRILMAVTPQRDPADAARAGRTGQLLLYHRPHAPLRRSAAGEPCASGVEQVVILGAGYDLRAFRFENELRGVQVFELDHPGTQARKKQLLKSSNASVPSNVTLIGIDFAKQSFCKLLPEHGFRHDVKTLFLWEGVSYYLPLQAVDEVLKFVAGCAPGSSVVFDYALQSFVDGDTGTYGGEQIARWLKKIGEPFLFGLNPASAQRFLAKRGLRVVSHVGPSDLERMYLTTQRNRSLGRTLGHVRIIEAQS